MPDYRTFSTVQLAEVLCKYVDDFEDKSTSEFLSVDWILNEVRQGRAVFESEEYGIALIRPEGWRKDAGNSLLWLLFISNDIRGNGFGKSFVVRLRSKYEQHLPMVLGCTGGSRIRFFESCGFIVKRLCDGGAVMISGCISNE